MEKLELSVSINVSSDYNELMSNKSTITGLALAILFSLLTAAGAYMRLPFRPFEPVTLQIFFVLLAGFILGPYWGALSQIIYTALSIFNVPIFNASTYGFPRPSFFASPDFMRTWMPLGYLLGFIAAAFFIGKFTADKESSFFSILLVMLTAVFLIYDMGIVYFYIIGIPIHLEFFYSLLGYMVFDLIKSLLAAIVAYRMKPLL